MNCVELIELFNKIGGILYCDYNKNKVWVHNTNLECNIKTENYKNLEKLAHEFAFSPYELKHLTYNYINSKDISNIKLKNKYLSNNEYGFTIKYL